jgi:hypothetical protein
LLGSEAKVTSCVFPFKTVAHPVRLMTRIVATRMVINLFINFLHTISYYDQKLNEGQGLGNGYPLDGKRLSFSAVLQKKN